MSETTKKTTEALLRPGLFRDLGPIVEDMQVASFTDLGERLAEIRVDEHGKKHYHLKAEPGVFGLKSPPKEPSDG